MQGEDVGNLPSTTRFIIKRRLGAGGMGEVFEAIDKDQGSVVALKTLSRIDAMGVYRFKQEFRSLAEIVHPNLVQLYELCSDGGQWFFTMELIEDGIPFLDYIQGKQSAKDNAGARDIRSPAANDPAPAVPAPTASMAHHGPMDGPEAKGVETVEQPGGRIAAPGDIGTVEQFPRGSPEVAPLTYEPANSRVLDDAAYSRLRSVFRQLAQGVMALHNAGKLHRDLKPANVLIRSDGRVVILDFGLVAELGTEPMVERRQSLSAAPTEGSYYHSTDGHIVGTIAYMSPEQAAALPLTTSSDWYAVGAMLFHTVTGQHAFRGKGMEFLDNKKRLNPPAPAELASSVPDDLNRLCVELMQRDPAARPSGAEVAPSRKSSATPGSGAR